MEPTSDQLRTQPEKPTLGGELRKGWYWMVFVWRMLGRMGGPLGIARTFWLVGRKLLHRTLVQWGVIR
jgi:hypothetical protein